MRLLLFLVLFTGCAIPIQEEDFYTDRGPDGAVETHYFSTDVTDIGQGAWDSIREGMTCMSGKAIADIKGEIEKLCTKTACSEQTKVALKRTLRALDPAFSRLEAAQALPLSHR